MTRCLTVSTSAACSTCPERFLTLLTYGPKKGANSQDRAPWTEVSRVPLFRDTVETAAKHTPQEPHWYLAVIGADPAAQGQGHGAALLRSGLAKADAAGLPAYLESTKPSNLPFYEHFGFTVREELLLPGDGPVLWAMWREPRRPADA